jgi:ligand-binding sensor domain-containing protein
MVAAACLLQAMPGLLGATETWQRQSIPGDHLVGMGELPFPDGQRAAWVSSSSGSYRRIDGRWERWPRVGEENPILRSILVAPDENGLTSWWLATPDGLLRTQNGQDWTHHDEQSSALADRDILSLHLSQSPAGQPEVWIGSRSGLTIWRMGQWEAVLARPNGFHGGPVTAMRSLFREGRRQTWVLGPTGLSRYYDGRWQRWAGDCLRGHRLNAIETLETPAEMVLLIGTDRGLLELSLDDPAFCRPLSSPDQRRLAVQGLARDRHERILVFTDQRVERWVPPRLAGAGWRWTFFDQRDGLDDVMAWSGRQRLDADGRVWAASERGLWLFDPADPPPAPDRRPPLTLGHGQAQIAAGSDQPLRFTTAMPELSLSGAPDGRPHAVRYRFSLLPSAAPGTWQFHGRLEPGPIGFGLHRLNVEMADEFGRIHGPYEFPIQRRWPLAVIVLVIAGALLVVAGGVMLILRRRG